MALVVAGCDLDKQLAPDEFSCGFGGPCGDARISDAADVGVRPEAGGDADAGAADRDIGIDRDAGADRDELVSGRDLGVDAGSPDAADLRDGGICDASTFDCLQTSCCPYGYRCANDVCRAEPDPNLCTACNNRRGACGGLPNLCLTNPSYDPGDPMLGPQFYCSVDCGGAAECPNGYTCGQVKLRIGDLCDNDGQCPGRCLIDPGEARGICSCMGDPDCQLDALPAACLGSCGGSGLLDCRTDGDCAAGACDLSTPRCQWPANQVCGADDDCDAMPLCQDIGGSMRCVTDLTVCADGRDCRCRDGFCLGSRKGCRDADDCDVPCVGGVCEVGHACSPQPGLTCADL